MNSLDLDLVLNNLFKVCLFRMEIRSNFQLFLYSVALLSIREVLFPDLLIIFMKQ